MKISIKRAKELIERGSLLIDLRSPVDFKERKIDNELGGGSINVPLTMISRLYEKPKKTTLIFLSSDEQSITLAETYSQEMGFTKIFNVGVIK